jgi:hypothetical protein
MFANIIYANAVFGDLSEDIKVPDIDSAINVKPFFVEYIPRGAISVFPPGPRNYADNIIVSCKDEFILKSIVQGDFSGKSLYSRLLSTGLTNGRIHLSVPIPFGDGFVTALCFAQIGHETPTAKFIQWSKIGVMDFTIDESNIAGKLPLPLDGFVLSIQQIKSSNTIIVGTENGIFSLKPNGIYYVHEKILNEGLLCKTAAISTLHGVFFISNKKELWQASTQGLRKIGYRDLLRDDEYKMEYLPEKNLVLIISTISTYLLNVQEISMSMSNYISRGTYFSDKKINSILSPIMPTTDGFYAAIGYYDFGTRKAKTIHTIEMESEQAQQVDVMLSFKVNEQANYTGSIWKTFGPNGKVAYAAYGTDFIINVRSSKFIPDFNLEDIKIHGRINGYIPQDNMVQK